MVDNLPYTNNGQTGTVIAQQQYIPVNPLELVHPIIKKYVQGIQNHVPTKRSGEVPLHLENRRLEKLQRRRARWTGAFGSSDGVHHDGD